MLYGAVTFLFLAGALVAVFIGRVDYAVLLALGAIMAAIWRVGDAAIALLNQYQYRDYPPELRPKG